MRYWMWAIFLWGWGAGMSAAQEANKPGYPPSREDNVVDVLHGVKIVDPYRWLEDGASAETKAWVEEQNKFTQALLGKVAGRDKSARGSAPCSRSAASARRSPPRDATSTPAAKGRRINPSSSCAKGSTARTACSRHQCARQGWHHRPRLVVSQQGRQTARLWPVEGRQRSQSTLHVRDVDTGKDLPDKIERTRACSLAWKPDGEGFYYTRYPAVGSVPKGKENYYRHVFYHAARRRPERTIARFSARAAIPKIGRASRCRPTDAGWPSPCIRAGPSRKCTCKTPAEATAKFQPVAEKTPALFDVIVRNDRFYIHTNHEAPRYRLLSSMPDASAKLDRSNKLEGDLRRRQPDMLEEHRMHRRSSRRGIHARRDEPCCTLFDRDGKRVERGEAADARHHRRPGRRVGRRASCSSASSRSPSRRASTASI